MGPCRIIWDHTGPYVTIGTIRDHKGPKGTIGDHMGPYGTIQDHMVPYGTIAGYFKLMMLFQTSRGACDPKKTSQLAISSTISHTALGYMVKMGNCAKIVE